MEYNPSEIEPKWRKWWQENGTYQVNNHSEKPKYYILDMFPYPSGAGLHVGHPLGYIASDIMARYKRLKGFNVLHPMGYDSFGLPAEQYAIQTGIHPEVATEQNITRYREQLENIGFSFDWSREVRTSSPEYYRWTQWIFMQLFGHYFDKKAEKALPIAQLEQYFAQNGNAGIQAACDDDTPAFSAAEWNAMSKTEQQQMLLKYRLTFPSEEFVNWCPGLGSVLSNDEVKDGVSERGGYPVERVLMKQWVMRITAYADRLIDGLDTVEWPDPIKDQQRNWIGRSKGASVKFGVDGYPDYHIEVFTTRVDTIYGVSFMVLAPEHELVRKLTTDAQRSEIDAYVRWAASRSELERMSEVKKVTGAFTGAYAINPFNGERVPIWIADYVLAGYGTGAVMAVPSGDQRDWNFARHFNLPVIPILDAQQNIEEAADPTKEGRYINSGMINGMDYETAVPTLVEWLEKKGLGKGKTQYKLRNAVFSRQRYWGEPVPVYWDSNNIPHLIDEADLPLTLPKVDKYLPTETGEPPLGRAKDWYYKPKDGSEGGPLEMNTMPGWAGSSWYFYRYMDPQNGEAFCSPEAINYWQDVDLYIGGSEHAVGHLLYSRFWNHFLFDTGLAPKKEFAKKLINQGMIQGRSSFVYRAKERFFEEYLMLKVLKPFFNEQGPFEVHAPDFEEAWQYDFAFGASDLVIEVTSYKLIDKIEQIRAAAESDQKRLLVLSIEELADNINRPDRIAEKISDALKSKEKFIMSRETPKSEQLFVSFNLVHKYNPENLTRLHVDISYVNNDFLDTEKVRQVSMFKNAAFKLDADGKFLTCPEVEKMSKSKYNVVNPDDMVAQYGADCFRMYEMFLGPIEVSKPWNTNGITGVSGFLRKFWSLFFDNAGQWKVVDDAPSADELRVLHTCIKKVTEDIERFSMNTCVSHFMIATNELRDLKCSKRAVLEAMLALMAPFAPHVSEELWHLLGHTSSVCDAQWPVLNETYLKTDSINYPIQINGKLRAHVDLPSGCTDEEAIAAALAVEQVKKWLDGQTPKKVIHVKGRMINIVV